MKKLNVLIVMMLSMVTLTVNAQNESKDYLQVNGNCRLKEFLREMLK
jgi:hypothetical protein